MFIVDDNNRKIGGNRFTYLDVFALEFFLQVNLIANKAKSRAGLPNLPRMVYF